jgi:hypothetical protein
MEKDIHMLSGKQFDIPEDVKEQLEELPVSTETPPVVVESEKKKQQQQKRKANAKAKAANA